MLDAPYHLTVHLGAHEDVLNGRECVITDLELEGPKMPPSSILPLILLSLHTEQEEGTFKELKWTTDEGVVEDTKEQGSNGLCPV